MTFYCNGIQQGPVLASEQMPTEEPESEAAASTTAQDVSRGRLAVGHGYETFQPSEIKRLSAPQLPSSVTDIRDGETYKEYAARIQAAEHSPPEEPKPADDLLTRADRRWLEGRANQLLAALGIERPTVRQRRDAYLAAAGLLARARR